MEAFDSFRIDRSIITWHPCSPCRTAWPQSSLRRTTCRPRPSRVEGNGLIQIRYWNHRRDAMYAHRFISLLKSELGNGVHVLNGELRQKQAFSQLLHSKGPVREFAIRRRFHKSAAVTVQWGRIMTV